MRRLLYPANFLPPASAKVPKRDLDELGQVTYRPEDELPAWAAEQLDAHPDLYVDVDDETGEGTLPDGTVVRLVTVPQIGG